MYYQILRVFYYYFPKDSNIQSKVENLYTSRHDTKPLLLCNVPSAQVFCVTRRAAWGHLLVGSYQSSCSQPPAESGTSFCVGANGLESRLTLASTAA